LQRCAIHPPRPAFAVCMACRKPICQECATQWDGIWHCARCLAEKRGATAARSQIGGWIAVVLSSAVLLYLSARTMVWVAALVSGLL
jgi:hypothetical protein